MVTSVEIMLIIVFNYQKKLINKIYFSKKDPKIGFYRN